MFSKPATLLVLLAASAQIAVATPPACLLAAINTEKDPSDLKTICGAHSDDVKDQIKSVCHTEMVDKAMDAFNDVCKNAKTSSTSSGSMSATPTPSGMMSTASASMTGGPSMSGDDSDYVTMTSTYYDTVCSCTKTSSGIAKATPTGAMASATGAPGSGSSGSTGGSGAPGSGSSGSSSPGSGAPGAGSGSASNGSGSGAAAPGGSSSGSTGSGAGSSGAGAPGSGSAAAGAPGSGSAAAGAPVSGAAGSGAAPYPSGMMSGTRPAGAAQGTGVGGMSPTATGGSKSAYTGAASRVEMSSFAGAAIAAAGIAALL